MDQLSCLDLLDSLFDGVYYVDRDLKITFWNRAAARISGYSAEEVLGKRCSDNILRHVDEQGGELCRQGCPLHETLQDGRPREADVYLHHKLGHRVPVQLRVAPVRNRQGDITGCVEIFSDNSSYRQIIEDLERFKKEALLDSLTELGNRRYAEIILQTRLYENRKFASTCGLLFFDVDHFKRINDLYGHQFGDQVLVMVGKTAAATLRRFDVVARWGGEEFLVIMAGIEQEVLRKTAERIRILVAGSFIVSENEKVSVTVSIGATMIREDDNLNSLLARADRLMYQGKEQGRNRVVFG